MSMDLPDTYWQYRTHHEVIDGLFHPATACAQCGKWFPPYKAAVPMDSVDEYCWGHDPNNPEAPDA